MLQIDEILGKKNKTEQDFFKHVGTYQYFVQNTPLVKEVRGCAPHDDRTIATVLVFLYNSPWFVRYDLMKLLYVGFVTGPACGYYHYMREQLHVKTITLTHITSREQRADLLKKTLLCA